MIVNDLPEDFFFFLVLLVVLALIEDPDVVYLSGGGEGLGWGFFM